MGLDKRAEIARAWQARGFSCGLWVDQPGQVWDDYLHSVDEVLIVLEGQLELKMLGQVVRPRIGEEIFIPAGTQHSVRNIGRGTARWLYGYKQSAGCEGSKALTRYDSRGSSGHAADDPIGNQ